MARPTDNTLRWELWGDLLWATALESGITTQTELAEVLGVTQSTASRWIRGLMAPSDDQKIKIAAHFGIAARELFPLEELVA